MASTEHNRYPNYGANNNVFVEHRSQENSGDWASRSIWDSHAAAWTWAPRRYAWPGWKRASRHWATWWRTPATFRRAIAEQKKAGDPHAKYLKEITATCTKHAEMVLKTLEAGMVPLVLGGDHSVAAGTVAGVAEFYRRAEQKIGLIWIDAHTDINTPDTRPAATSTACPWPRSWDWGRRTGEYFRLFARRCNRKTACWWECATLMRSKRRTSAAQASSVFTMRDIDERGMRTVMEEALRMAGRGTAGYHVSLDMDWIDPEDAPGVGTPVRGGATYREAHLAMEIIADHGRMLSFEIVEVNPVIDEHNRTADLAVELAQSAFGKKIL